MKGYEAWTDMGHRYDIDKDTKTLPKIVRHEDRQHKYVWIYACKKYNLH